VLTAFSRFLAERVQFNLRSSRVQWNSTFLFKRTPERRGKVVEGAGSILTVEGRRACGVAKFPLIGEPGVKVAGGPGWQVHEELGEVELGIDLVPAAGRGQAGENSGGAAATRVADEQGVFAAQHHAFHLALRDVMPTPGLCRGCTLGRIPAWFPIVVDAA